MSKIKNFKNILVKDKKKNYIKKLKFISLNFYQINFLINFIICEDKRLFKLKIIKHLLNLNSSRLNFFLNMNLIFLNIARKFLLKYIIYYTLKLINNYKLYFNKLFLFKYIKQYNYIRQFYLLNKLVLYLPKS